MILDIKNMVVEAFRWIIQHWPWIGCIGLKISPVVPIQLREIRAEFFPLLNSISFRHFSQFLVDDNHLNSDLDDDIADIEKLEPVWRLLDKSFLIINSRGAVAQSEERPSKVMGHGATLLTSRGFEPQTRQRI